MAILFWLSLFIVFYTYIGYGIVLFVAVKFLAKKRILPSTPYTPSLTVVIAAYNEENIIRAKIENTLSLDYPADKITYIVVTDGSTDATPAAVAAFPQVKLMHKEERSGKIAAVHRVMKEVDTDIVVYTDANTFLNREALRLMMRHYADPETGAVSGEKRVQVDARSDATAGEGFYWRYESKLKKWDSELYTVVGAAGELFSIRTSLYQPVPQNALLDDFMISMMIVLKGYRIIYEPDAYAMEKSSANVEEELKRKIRIASGGIQSMVWLKQLLNPFPRPLLSFQYISHRVLRWTAAPLLMLLAFVLNILMVADDAGWLYRLLLVMQIAFYASAVMGWLFEKKSIRVKILFIPYYFCVMNYAVLAGMLRYLRQKPQTGVWEKAKRKE
ncbi:glycosyltransferase family 2 protein [Sediminibacterium soli]|uniref:glycosyltransferase family 2 protein n=1 Tax=Sediminibacterium soli TaxID=2698829 RepID=UPI00137AEE8D|nr:glycosyltransferase family 2 protein [Sediminibacterium soli]NCI45560.1 glycosyltransferase family 2 protein [Sediminibacterium soli]